MAKRRAAKGVTAACGGLVPCGLGTPFLLTLLLLTVLWRRTEGPVGKGVVAAIKEILDLSTSTSTTLTTTTATSTTTETATTTTEPPLPASTRMEPQVKLDMLKIAWMHFPKAGSSFANIILSWACPDLPDKKLVTVPWIDATWHKLKWELEADGHCVAKLDLGVGHIWIHKTGEHNSWSKSKGHFMGMFKQPEQRLLSGFKYGRHGIGGNTMPLLEYCEKISGCVVRMINGISCNDIKRKMGVEDAERAIRVIDEGFAFVGLTDQWDMSVCLFHKMFGEECREREFKNINFKAENKKATENFWNASTGSWNNDLLQGFKDVADGMVYDHVSRVFRARLKHYQLDWDTCNRTCFKGRAMKPKPKKPKRR